MFSRLSDSFEEKRALSSFMAGSSIGFFPQQRESVGVSVKTAILLLGAPGVGKSTQAACITQQRANIMCVSTGNLVRKLEKKQREGGVLTDIESAAAESLDCMRRGELMDDKAVYALLMAHLSPGGEGFEEYSRKDIIILDGVIKAQRNIAPFEAALRTFNEAIGSMPMNLKHVINISATRHELMSRQRARVVQAVEEGRAPRPDDHVDTYRMRLDAYMSKTQEVIDYYKTNHSLIDVDSSQGIKQTTMVLIDAIDHIDQVLATEAHTDVLGRTGINPLG